MARDSEKYKIFPVAILRDSWVLDMIEADAVNHQMPDHVNKLLALRITEYYKLIKDGVISAAMLGGLDVAASSHHNGKASASGSPTARRDHQASAARESTAGSSSTTESGGSVGISDNAEINADAALGYFEPLE
jgi:hypothetical protein